MKNKITQKEAIFYQLYLNRKKDKNEFVPIWKLIGEVWCSEVHKWGFVSYEVSARVSEICRENPNLLESKRMTGKTNARYYGYRINLLVNIEDIKNESLLKFYKDIKRNEKREATKNK